jgi:hypothetical protein
MTIIAGTGEYIISVIGLALVWHFFLRNSVIGDMTPAFYLSCVAMIIGGLWIEMDFEEGSLFELTAGKFFGLFMVLLIGSAFIWAKYFDPDRE